MEGPPEEVVEAAEEVEAVVVVAGEELADHRHNRRWAAWGRLVDMGVLLGVLGHLRRSLTGS